MAQVFTKGGWGWFLLPLAVGGVFFAYLLWGGTKDKEEGKTVAEKPPAKLDIAIDELPPSEKGHYELWEKKLNGGQQLLGSFRVMEGGIMAGLAGDPLEKLSIREVPPDGSLITVTLEKGRVPASSPSKRVLLSGELDTTKAKLSSQFPKVKESQYALIGNPEGTSISEKSGVWFAKDINKGEAVPGLQLPALEKGWTYGGWVVTGSTNMLFTGAFDDPTESDNQQLYGEMEHTWEVPGESFAENAPEGVEFPLNLTEGRAEVLVSLEPDFGGEWERERPFWTLLSGRVPYKQAPEEPFTLELVEDKLPGGEINIRP